MRNRRVLLFDVSRYPLASCESMTDNAFPRSEVPTGISSAGCLPQIEAIGFMTGWHSRSYQRDVMIISYYITSYTNLSLGNATPGHDSKSDHSASHLEHSVGLMAWLVLQDPVQSSLFQKF